MMFSCVGMPPKWGKEGSSTRIHASANGKLIFLSVARMEVTSLWHPRSSADVPG